MIDLHTHSTASDGQHSPEELVSLACTAGIDTLSVTDHDTVAGIADAQRAATRLGLRLVPGIELSSLLDEREAHVLGHFIDPNEPEIQGFSQMLRGEREERMVRMLRKLKALGLQMSLEDVVRMSGGKNLGRPHLARALVERGEVRDVKEAFDRYLAAGASAYVERFKFSSHDAIALIRRAGGAATLAHPSVSRLTRQEIGRLKATGLAGLEVFHADHSTKERADLLEIARELDLVPTAGSDFHGEAVVPGRRLGTTEMDRENLARLEARRGAAN